MEGFITQAEAHAGPDASYYGERGHWYLVLGTRRAADTLTLSNWAVALERLEGVDGWAVEHSSHWAAGQVSALLIEPDSEAEPIAREFTEQLEDYPVLDEEHYSDLESEHTEQLWGEIPLRTRILELAGEGCSIFAARANSIGELLDRGLDEFVYDHLRVLATEGF